MIKLFIVDDHTALRDSFAHAFAEMEGFQVVGSIANASLAELYCRKLCPDVVLTDICTENESSGLAATARLKEVFPNIKVVVMTGFDEISYIKRAKDAGADAFLYKSRTLDFFCQVIRDVMEGGTYFPEPRKIPVPTGEAPLTDREMDILLLLCKNKSRKEIAAELFISESTVKRHVENMLAKTGFSNSVELAFYMITNGWINPKY